MIIVYGDNFLVNDESGNLLKFSGITCSGAFTGPTSWGWNIPNIKFVAVELKPLFAAHVFKEDLRGLVDQSADNLHISKSLGWLCGALSETPGIVDKLNLLNGALKKYFHSRNLFDLAPDNNNSLLTFLFKNIQRSYGTIDPVFLEKETGFSSKTLTRKLRLHTGFSLGRYCRFIRSENAIRLLLTKGYSTENIQNIVFQLNYFDQSHLINDLRNFTNLTPKTLASENGYECLAGVLSN